jgi:CheY-like chemotaxis protein
VIYNFTMNPDAVRRLQAQLGVPQTGVFDAATSSAMSAAVGTAVAANRDVARYAGASGADAIVNAYMTGDWSGVTDYTGKPFSDAQQQAAVREAERVLGPAFKAAESYDRAVVDDTLRQEGEAFQDFRRDEARDFRDAKQSLDQSAADQGVLFSGARLQKQNDLREIYSQREATQRRNVADRIASTARGYQYEHGNDAADRLSARYRLPVASRFDAGVAGGKVTPGRTLASAYDTGAYKFQGTKPVAQQAAVQTRAAGQLAARANKLSLSGYGTKI